ncbi:MAG: type II toxin-antitoxin system YoeB family toxin [Bacteroidia bacterium]|nr:type II toxin-antitoxin system YoeB family toxin [Bacteroidia bacterium]
MEWISEYNDPTKRNLILSWFKNPFTDELSEVESEKYFESEYIITSEAAPQRESPVGITVASIKMLPTISFDSHTFWRNKEIEISRTCQTQASNSTLEVHNICLESDITSSEFNRWLEEFYPHFISGEGMVRMYLNYGKYASRFTPTFLQHFKEWKKEDIVTFKYILRLMKDIEHFPFAGGMGQTENLKGRGKEGSKRINNKYPDGDRLSYSIEQNIVTFIACKGHYEFHD